MSGPQEERLSEWSKEADSTPLVEWKQHRNRISTRLGIGEYLQKSPKNEEEDDNDNINELLVTSSSSYDNNILSDHDSMEDTPINISFSASSPYTAIHNNTSDKNHFQLLARNHELEDALDTSQEHIELLSEQLSSTNNNNKTSNHIILKLKDQYQQLEGTY